MKGNPTTCHSECCAWPAGKHRWREPPDSQGASLVTTVLLKLPKPVIVEVVDVCHVDGCSRWIDGREGGLACDPRHNASGMGADRSRCTGFAYT